MRKLIVMILSVLLLSVFLVGCTPRRGDTIVIASKDYTEQDIMGHMLNILIRENTTLNTDLRSNMNSFVIYQAIVAGHVDVYVEYSGTIVGAFFGDTEPRHPDETFRIAREGMRERYNALYLDRLGFNNTYTLAVRPDTAERFNLRTISDLARVSPELTIGAGMEFLNREDGIIGVRRVYGMNFGREMVSEGAIRYAALMNDEIQVIDAFSTDGMLLRHQLVVLEDNLDFFPAYHAAVLIRRDTAERFPQLMEVLNKLPGTLNDNSMRDLNYRVDVLHESPESVARSFLRGAGLIP